MSRGASLCEIVQFRAPPGTVSALEAVARAEGKGPAQLLREAVEQRLAIAGVQVGAAMRSGY